MKLGKPVEVAALLQSLTKMGGGWLLLGCSWRPGKAKPYIGTWNPTYGIRRSRQRKSLCMQLPLKERSKPSGHVNIQFGVPSSGLDPADVTRQTFLMCVQGYTSDIASRPPYPTDVSVPNKTVLRFCTLASCTA